MKLIEKIASAKFVSRETVRKTRELLRKLRNLAGKPTKLEKEFGTEPIKKVIGMRKSQARK